MKPMISADPDCGADRVDHHSAQVEIYVTDHCFVCEYSYEIAAMIRQEFPDVALEVINMSDPSREIPAAVFATPTYLLNGKVWSLGNPSPQEVRSRLATLQPGSGS